MGSVKYISGSMAAGKLVITVTECLELQKSDFSVGSDSHITM